MAARSDVPPIAALVLAGGRGSRMGGVDKAALQVANTTLLERALAATRRASVTVVVGDRVDTSRDVTWEREDPIGGGPVAALYAGLDTLPAGARAPELVAVIAVDMPHVTAATLSRLANWTTTTGDDGAILEDEAGHLQPLCAVYRINSLRQARPPDVRHQSMKSLLTGMLLTHVRAESCESRDIDTWDDLDHWRRKC